MPDETVGTAEFSADGQSITTTSSTSSGSRLAMRLWAADSGEPLSVKVLEGEKNDVVETDGRLAVIINRLGGGTARIFDIASGSQSAMCRATPMTRMWHSHGWPAARHRVGGV
jgi:hypothetical protein